MPVNFRSLGLTSLKWCVVGNRSNYNFALFDYRVYNCGGKIFTWHNLRRMTYFGLKRVENMSLLSAYTFSDGRFFAASIATLSLSSHFWEIGDKKNSS